MHDSLPDVSPVNYLNLLQISFAYQSFLGHQFSQLQDRSQSLEQMFNIYGKTIKRQGHFLIQPVDVFPAHDEQPGPSTDDYIKNPDYPAEAYF